MITLDQVRDALSQYVLTYRHPDLPPLEMSGIYDLFPEDHADPVANTCAVWPANYPNRYSRGVYLMLGAHQQLLYVGKVSMNNSFDSRLAGYFSYTTDGKKRCQVKHDTWGTRPEFLITIPVSSDMAFEAAALEEYLIDRLQPPDNTKGKR